MASRSFPSRTAHSRAILEWREPSMPTTISRSLLKTFVARILPVI
jgi:hypothetical protein